MRWGGSAEHDRGSVVTVHSLICVIDNTRYRPTQTWCHIPWDITTALLCLEKLCQELAIISQYDRNFPEAIVNGWP